jgi:UDP-glucose 4-epimerase
MVDLARPPHRCLVLGGAGFLGGHIVESLLDEGYAVRVFDRLPRRTTVPAAVEWVEGDFGNRGDLSNAVEGCETAIHLVATTLPKTSNDDPVHDLETNLLPTVRFLDLARDKGLRRVVFASSGGTVYGIPARVPIAEVHPTHPICSYGIHKLAVEQYLHLYHTLHGLEYCILRLANPYGGRQRADATQGAVAVFLDKALKHEEITVWGDGSVIRDYVYVADVARAFCMACAQAEPTGTFNIGSGEGQSLEQLIDAIGRLLGRRLARRYIQARAFDVPANVLDTALAARVLGWSPRFTFDEGLRRTLDTLLESARH